MSAAGALRLPNVRLAWGGTPGSMRIQTPAPGAMHSGPPRMRRATWGWSPCTLVASNGMTDLAIVVTPGPNPVLRSEERRVGKASGRGGGAIDGGTNAE